MSEIERERVSQLAVYDAVPYPVHEGRRYLVVGGAGGIGGATAELLCRESASVVIADTKLAEAAERSEQVNVAVGRDAASAVQIDVTDWATVADAVSKAAETMGGIDGLVNAAGAIRVVEAFDHTMDDWMVHYNVNVFGLFEACRLTAQHMAENEIEGSIVNIASEAGKVGHPYTVSYNSSKAAVINLTRTLAQEWAPLGINVNCVCPGGVAAPMLRECAVGLESIVGTDADELLPVMLGSQLNRHIAPVEVAHAISFLLTDRARAIRGQAINTDGGTTPY